MARSNSTILSDVSACLCDAMDTMFNNGHSIIIPEDKNMNINIPNNSGPLSAEALKLMMNKRKLASTIVTDEEQQYQENENDSAKRLCTTNGHHQHEQKT